MDKHFSILYTDERADQLLSEVITDRILQIPSYRELVILCIGTDRSTGDSLGPLIGSKLRQAQLSNVSIYGHLDQPVHAVNLAETLDHIHTLHKHPFIIAIDACLGRLKSVGLINLIEGPLKPGAGVNKELPAVGNIHITGIVNVGGFMEYFVLQNTRLGLVMKMADVISSAFCLSLQQVHSEKNGAHFLFRSPVHSLPKEEKSIF
jgi:putative sporulation protein YyaC